MSTENTVDKVKLISELKEIHSELFQVYKKLFDFKYKHDETFKIFIDNEYKENGVGSKEQKAWDDNFCHRASYTLLNKILFVRICEDKGFMRNAEDYIAGEVKDPHIGEKLSKVGLQKWGRLITNYTLGELIKFAFNDMRKSYSNIVLYKEDKYEILSPRDEEFSLKYIDGDNETKDLVLDFENVLNSIIEKLDTNNFNFKYTDGNILGDVYEKFMDRETRKVIGQFYTPEYVIEYILKSMVEEIDVVENPFVTIADISCGSGHFLIMTYDILRKKFIANLETLKKRYAEDIYIINKDGKEVQQVGEEYWIKENIHYHILKYCIYGADIDSFAVQLTTINLLLKDLDNFTDELNIIQCDSLIKWEVDYDWQGLKEQLEQRYIINKYENIDLFGNRQEFEKEEERKEYIINYINLIGQKEQRVLSREDAEEILKIGQFWSRKFDYVVGNPPYITALLGKKQNKSTSNDLEGYYKKRYPNSSQYKLNLFALFIERGIEISRVGMGYIIPSSILTNYYFETIRKYILESVKIRRILKFNYDVFEDAITGGNVILTFNIRDKFDNESLVEALEVDTYESYITQKYSTNKFNQEEFNKLPNFKFLTNIDMINFITKMKKDTERLGDIAVFYNGIKTGDNKKFLSDKKLSEKYKPVVRGRDVFKYFLNESGVYVYFDKDKLWSNTNEEMYLSDKKIIVRQTSDSIVGTIDENKNYTMDTTHLIIPNNLDNIYCILGILNSKVMDFYYKQIVPELDKAFAEVKISNLKELPINLNNHEIVARVTNNVKNVINYNYRIKQLKNKIKKSISTIDSLADIIEYIVEIDELYYEIKKLEREIDEDVYLIYKLDNTNLAKEVFGDKKININISEKIRIKELVSLLKSKSLEEVCKEYKVDYLELWEYRSENVKGIEKESIINFYNVHYVYETIQEYLYKNIIEYFNDRQSYEDISALNTVLKDKNVNYDVLMAIMKKDDITKKYEQILKDILNKTAYTWNAFRKDKSQDKVSKTFIKYYDSNYYGLAEWSDEIHKQYFMEAIDEYTVNSPNEKKAKDILKLFNELDIEDKEDYVDIIEDKIKKAFS